MLNLITEPSQFLHSKTQKITVFDNKLIKLIQEMRNLMISSNGIGLAAPQIGKLIQLIIIEIPNNIDENDQSIKEVSPLLVVLINPKIIHHSQASKIDLEGCLSLPGIGVKVKRFLKLKIKANNEYGKEIIINASNLFARVIQHEIDHLNGILITDHGPTQKYPEN